MRTYLGGSFSDRSSSGRNPGHEETEERQEEGEALRGSPEIQGSKKNKKEEERRV